MTLLFGIKGERKGLLGYLPLPSGLLVSMAAPHQARCPTPDRKKVAGRQGSSNGAAQGGEGGAGADPLRAPCCSKPLQCWGSADGSELSALAPACSRVWSCNKTQAA